MCPRSPPARRPAPRRRPRPVPGGTPWGRSRREPLERLGEGVDTGQAVRHLGVLRRRVGDAGRVAHEQHRARDPLRGQDPGVVPGLGRQDRPVAGLVVDRDPACQVGVEVDGPRDRLGRDLQPRPVALRALRRLPRDRRPRARPAPRRSRTARPARRSRPTARSWSSSVWCRPGRRSRADRRPAPACWPPARSSRRSASGRDGPPSASCPHGWAPRRCRSGSARAARSGSPRRPRHPGRPGPDLARRAAPRSTPSAQVPARAGDSRHRSHPRPSPRRAVRRRGPAARGRCPR